MDDRLHGIIDMHVHSNPDLRRRSCDDLELADAAVYAGARAVVIKSHHGSTAERAWLCNRYLEKTGRSGTFTMFGSITLNRTVGGLNLLAVETALRMGAKVVWMPTFSAENHIRKTGGDLKNAVPVTAGGKIVPEMEEILRLVRKYDAVLATGHLAPAESFIVAEEAHRIGIEKTVITHPEWWLVGMTMEEQKEITDRFGVYLERCYAQNMGGGKYRSNLPENAEAVRKIGCEHILISTDGGQTENPLWADAVREYLNYLSDHGIPETQIRRMSHDNPASLLNL